MRPFHISERRSARARTLGRLAAAIGVTAATLGASYSAAYAQVPATTEERKAAVREATLAQVGPEATDAFVMGIYAYEDKPIATSVITDAVDSVLEDETGNFRLAQLVRVLFLTNDTREYDSLIVPRLRNVQFWQVQGQSSKYLYNTENHMILWMSSAYLMRQREGWAMDAQLDTRLTHYLRQKIQYGFYEYNSKTYYSRTLAALLNLADFATDPTIKSLAAQAAQRAMKDIIVFANDKGALFTPAGRSDWGMYRNYRPHAMVWIATGRGPLNVPIDANAENGGNADYGGQFVATTSVSLDPVRDRWTSSIDAKIYQGHPASEHAKVHAPLTRFDRLAFQWSAGAITTPNQLSDTLWGVSQGFGLPFPRILFDIAAAVPLLGGLATIGRGGDNSDVTFKVFRNGGSTLNSAERENGGFRGFEQMPWAATVDDLAVYTQSGPYGGSTDPKKNQLFGISNHTHLPDVKQQSNVALISYYPKDVLSKIGRVWGGLSFLGVVEPFGFDVHLYWPPTMDQTVESGRWVFGRRNNSYVAVYRDQTTRGPVGFVSNRNGGRQLWASVVGNATTHGGFDAFMNRVKQATVSERHYYDLFSLSWKYTTKISVDGKTLEHTMVG